MELCCADINLHIIECTRHWTCSQPLIFTAPYIHAETIHLHTPPLISFLKSNNLLSYNGSSGRWDPSPTPKERCGGVQPSPAPFHTCNKNMQNMQSGNPPWVPEQHGLSVPGGERRQYNTSQSPPQLTLSSQYNYYQYSHNPISNMQCCAEKRWQQPTTARLHHKTTR